MRKLRVVLVDDEIMIREGFKNYLTGAHMTVKSWVRRRMVSRRLG